MGGWEGVMEEIIVANTEIDVYINRWMGEKIKIIGGE